MKRKLKLIALLPLIILIYYPSFGSFFAADDWFHLKIIQINIWPEFVGFFSFVQNSLTAGSYRPLSTQVYFFSLYSLFGLNQYIFHLVNLIFFTANIYLTFLLTKKLLRDEKVAYLSAFFYGLSVTHFTKMYFISAFQETLMVFWVLLCILLFFSPGRINYIFSIICLIFGLFSKETAAVTPFILLVLHFFGKDRRFIRVLPMLILTGVYIYLRFAVFGKIQGESYIWDYAPRKLLNTSMWYVLWSFGLPELMIDYVSSGLRILPRFFTDFPTWSKVILSFIALYFVALAAVLFRNKRLLTRELLGFSILFMGSLGPVLFLPWHKFTIELTLPFVWFAMALAWLVSIRSQTKVFLFILAFFALNIGTNILSYRTHYSVNRARSAKQVYTYFTRFHPEKPIGKSFLIVSNQVPQIGPKSSSEELSYVLSGSDFFNVLYKDPEIKVFYEGKEDSDLENSIPISADQFLKVQ
ncbi:hypothetical protein A2631_02775 [Candidatus Daviesbacteria bacterium RIFCSPHIGHO2_01_FULL_44_29]|uniref:Glycosyltransferase RgtA/B/C/D-like domain-containing protein n=1 Tax=Candidatus Daviesbacteria bacterium RIFCSPHIGHO2_02_FULL_43_12 TaxID=1797776 RepID=A0A1F5KK56_9BACT|nr:MAG: hypothetical protein A2631_02775 [Candidatus Daviesbacteria bacterium RIFCSPHIGHO2_01_FULL_44_29]OGE40838.1 MAG: hypothetical protein A3E86_02575 [Candidatus Daviesbacteria bacterium RIFCSPHIGHO2_12_FULL_47_45]OGE41308.1 MAG: hypothetical protein A3D25_02170 [Candidatus Daviesbacteria bacterium RIFCSPHIGHO2_02_FULL_43_12]OGE69509.1 MAG: hypothetical protein A3B55_03910 [Candidatus Daviesbacteria bacterium RIFCSPLOWO2_01_FULL_43_15]